MAKRGNILPYEAMGRLMVKHGAGRVSYNAKIAMAEALEEYALKIDRLAARYAMHAGRVTVTDKDIELAVKNLEQIQ